MGNTFRHSLLRFAQITLGCALYALGFCWFYAPNQMCMGGFTGLAQVIGLFIPEFPVGVQVLLMNLPLFFLIWKKVGRDWLMASLYAMLVSSLLIDLLDQFVTFPPIEPVLACVYGAVLVGTGCGVPGVMASRTIENERDRRMTIMTTCFIPCGAKMPIIGLIAGAMFGGSPLVAVSAYFIGMAAIICSGIILKKTKLFAGDPAPFVMELPAYHIPAWGNVFRATWERGWSFIKRAGSVILAATVVLWFLQGFGFENGAFGMVEDQDNSVLAAIATKVAWIFAPLGFGNWKATVASVSGLIAKENVVGTFGVLYHFGGEELSENGDEIWNLVAADYTALSAYAFMIFNLLCAPCFAAMGAIKREMNNGKWTAIAIGYMCALAYCSALVVYQLGGLITGEVGFNFFTIVAAVILVAFIYLMVRPNKYVNDNEVKIDVSKIK